MNSLKNNWSLLFRFERAWLYLGLILLSLILTGLAGAFVPILVGQLSSFYTQRDLFHEAVLKLGLLFFALFAFRIFYQAATNLYVRGLLDEVRSHAFKKWLLGRELITEKEGDHSERFPAGEVIARLMSDTQAVKELITSGTFGIIIDIFFVMSALIGMLSLHFRSGILVFTVEAVASALLVYGGQYMRTAFHQVREARGLVSRQIANVCHGLKEAYLNPNHQYAKKSGGVAYTEFMDKQLMANVWDASYYSLAEGLYPVLLALLVVFFPLTEVKEAALLLIIVDFIQRSIGPIKNIAGKITNIQRAMTGVEKIQDFLSALEKAGQDDDHSGRKPFDFESLEISIDSFHYPKRKNAPKNPLEPGVESFGLRQIYLSFPKGHNVGLVGVSGCGKSTLLNILAGQIVPGKGKVVLHGQKGDIVFSDLDTFHEADFQRFRQEVCHVSQEAHVFEESVAFNIGMGQVNVEVFEKFWATMLENIPALKIWWPDPFMKILAKNLSHGQRQLLAVMRAFYFNRPVVLYDEIASGMDSSLEEAMRKAMDLLRRNTLVITVAHRIETVVESDCLIVMENGRLVGKGTHGELMRDSDCYKKFLNEISKKKTEVIDQVSPPLA